MEQTGQVEYILTNEALSNIQRQEIQGSIDTLKADKDHINSEIRRIHVTLQGLLSQRDAKDLQIKKLEGMISRLKDFPNELLSKVFEEYAMGMEHPPWILGHICSSWRMVALATPRAWSNVVVHFSESFSTYSIFDREKVLHNLHPSIISSQNSVSTSDVRARLGLKALALARLERALA
ncbi:hypothetical protein BDZ94DRAFT_1325407 [Collybia nuda]|uniref:F-box domain-containing protein n=1 Tax=Collybia nuda TaxID=64659 RepID=A0A9P5XZJ3_9AGAR|nr:hypothetical protein BDZ94DRAFT_1325407 [Collybia nuda]